MRTLYSRDGIVVRDSTKGDAVSLAERMRRSDIDEIWASHHHTPMDALLACRESAICLTVSNGKPLAMFGITPDNFLGDSAVIWMLGSEDIERIQTRFLRHSRSFVEMFLRFYPRLYNYVDARNEVSILWLKWIGAEVYPAMPYGAEQLPFRYFEFKRSL